MQNTAYLPFRQQQSVCVWLTDFGHKFKVAVQWKQRVNDIIMEFWQMVHHCCCRWNCRVSSRLSCLRSSIFGQHPSPLETSEWLKWKSSLLSIRDVWLEHLYLPRCYLPRSSKQEEEFGGMNVSYFFRFGLVAMPDFSARQLRGRLLWLLKETQRQNEHALPWLWGFWSDWPEDSVNFVLELKESLLIRRYLMNFCSIPLKAVFLFTLFASLLVCNLTSVTCERFLHWSCLFCLTF